MSVFRATLNQKTYSHSIIKIIICVLTIPLIIERDRLLYIENGVIQFIVSLFCFVICIVCILNIYISIAEIVCTYKNQNNSNIPTNEQIKNSEFFSTDKIISLLIDNDIMEIDVLFNDKITKIGTSSDSKPGKSKFFDKLFYIENKNFIDVKIFKINIDKYAVNGQLNIIAIDGINASKWTQDAVL